MGVEATNQAASGRLAGIDVTVSVPAPMANDPMRVTVAQSLLVLPSTYGLSAWLGALLILSLSPYDYPFKAATWAIFGYTLFVFACSMASWTSRARASALCSDIIYHPFNDRLLLIACTIVGGLGLALYVRDFSSFFGGVGSFFSTLAQSSLTVRGAAQDVESAGFQVSYLSWIAIFIAIFTIMKDQGSKVIRLLAILIVITFFMLNLAFVDRTRPTWIFFVCIIAVLLSRGIGKIQPRKVAYAVIVPVIFFFAFAIISGKYNENEGITDNFIQYIIGGPSYFNSLVGSTYNNSFTVVRTFLPISKALEQLGLIANVPPEVLDFRPVPFFTNVGTFLEPIYSDGGIWTLLAFLPIMVWTLDGFALSLFRMQTVMSRFIWANIVFTFFISFFVPKYNSTAAYVFLVVFFLDRLIRLSQGPSPEAAAALPASGHPIR